MKKLLFLFSVIFLTSFIGLSPARAEEDTAPVPELISAPAEICDSNQGLVVQRSDVSLPALFVLGCHNTIHVFPNEQTYKTWWPDFENISYVNGAFVGAKDLLGNVTIRPGTYLVKQTTDPKVYAVEPNGVLRWIPNEATAKTLYGSKWNTIIVDVPDELFADYTIGTNMTDTAYADGTIGYLPVEGRVVYLSGTSYFNLPGDKISSMRLGSKFLVPLSAAVIANYTDGGDLPYDTKIAFPF